VRQLQEIKRGIPAQGLGKYLHMQQNKDGRELELHLIEISNNSEEVKPTITRPSLK
jgi:hypothetical protein